MTLGMVGAWRERRMRQRVGASLPGELGNHARGKSSRVMLAGLGELEDTARDERPRLVALFCKLKRAANFLERPILGHRGRRLE
jgi:hypothetical protein